MKRFFFLSWVFVFLVACGQKEQVQKPSPDNTKQKLPMATGPKPTPPPAETSSIPDDPLPSTPTGKRTSGLVIGYDLELGGPSCFLEIESAMGGGILEHAAPEFCQNENLYNKTYQFTWEQREVVAESCQGDPECDDGEMAWVIVGLKEEEPGVGEGLSVVVLYQDPIHLNSGQELVLDWSADHAKAGDKYLYGGGGPDEPGCESDESGAVFSVVGPIVSVRTTNYQDCEGAAHPLLAAGLTAKNATTGKWMSLLDYWSEDEIFSAFNSDGFIQKHLHEPVSSMKEMYQSIESTCEFYFGKYVMNSFAFHHIKGDQVAIRVGLTHGCEVERGNYIELGMYLPIPDSLRADLNQAFKDSTLMAQMEKRPVS